MIAHHYPSQQAATIPMPRGNAWLAGGARAVTGIDPRVYPPFRHNSLQNYLAATPLWWLGAESQLDNLPCSFACARMVPGLHVV